ncbi:DUF2934 domain-containing protein [Propionivibrio limicola]|uniref:DUF2934 domain-containing protein n=1 Tax=Propionivibrio limicola TaxID=167645 RepID=UPI0012909029|nr:DUF2934 domain-containing protein [Propionivibrio limicola]
MKTKREFAHKSEGRHEQHVVADAGDFNAQRMQPQSEIKAKQESGNRPEGNYEYEQMVAEEANFDTKHMIEEAAFFIAEGRGFAPGKELSDWLQAEIDIHNCLQKAMIERRKEAPAS